MVMEFCSNRYWFWGCAKGADQIMGKVPVRLREVAYSLSPNHQYIMRGLFKDWGYKLSKKFHENWVSALTLVTPVAGTYWFVTSLPCIFYATTSLLWASARLKTQRLFFFYRETPEVREVTAPSQLVQVKKLQRQKKTPFYVSFAFFKALEMTATLISIFSSIKS